MKRCIVLAILVFLTIRFAFTQDFGDMTLIAHYPLSENTNDITGRNDTIQIANAPFRDGGIYCNGIYADGTPNACEVVTPQINKFNFASFGVSISFKIVDPITARLPILMFGYYYRWGSFFVTPDSFLGYSQGANFAYADPTDIKYTPDTWHTVSVIYDSAENKGRFYIDGVYADSSFWAFEHNNDRLFTVEHGGYGKTFKGFIKDIKFYSTVELTGLERDSLALVSLYNSSNGPGWTNNTNWLSGPVSTWQGITVLNDRVNRIHLSENNLVGTLPVEIGNLDSLEELNLSKNAITDTLPHSIGNLSKLYRLDLSWNEISGGLPASLYQMNTLVYLNLNHNQISDSLSTRIQQLPLLKELKISDNALYGEIPNVLGNLTHLTYLALSLNEFTGPIPAELGNLSQLNQLYLGGNQLEGTIPKELGQLKKMSVCILENCGISGSIPDEIGMCESLMNLNLSFNQLEGAIPEEIANLTKLSDLNLSNNQLTGSLPDSIGRLKDLYFFFVDNNNLQGKIPESIINITSVIRIRMHNNQLDHLPDFSSLSSLKELKIQDNQFTFEDIEPNMGIEGFEYSPQDSVGLAQDTTVNEGDVLQLSVQVGGSANQYQWFKDDAIIEGAVDSVLVFDSAAETDAGVYSCQITNSLVPDLTLYSRSMQVHIEPNTGIAEQNDNIPETWALLQNIPNPFNPRTHITYHLPQTSDVTLTVSNSRGQQVRQWSFSAQEAGVRHVIWNGRDAHGRIAASGVYFYQVSIFDQDRLRYCDVKKMLLLR